MYWTLKDKHFLFLRFYQSWWSVILLCGMQVRKVYSDRVSETKILQIFYYAVMFQNCTIKTSFWKKLLGKIKGKICTTKSVFLQNIKASRWEEPSRFSVKVMHPVSAKQMMSFAFPSRDTIATTYWIQRERFQRET